MHNVIKMWYGALGLTVVLVSFSLGLTIYNFMEKVYTDVNESYAAIVLLLLGYIVPFLLKEIHIVTSVVTMAVLARLSSNNDENSIVALVLYATAICTGHLIREDKQYK